MTSAPSLSRRGFLSAAAGTAGAVAAAPLLSACGTPAGTSGSTSANALSKILPAYVPMNSGPKPDFPSVNGSNPGYLNYPATLVHSVKEVPGSGGSYTAVAPDWGAIPRTSGNTYYQAMNNALGANISWQPTNGATITTTLPNLFAGNQLPDWIQVPTWAQPPGFGQATQTKLADLTPYLAGDKIKEYPNLAAIFSGGWQQGIWNGKIQGIPCAGVTGFGTGVFLFYRADVLQKLGLGTPSVKSLDDLYNLGKEINDPKAKRWAFDDIWQFMPYAYGTAFALPTVWTTDSKGHLITTYETDEIIEAMNWERKIFQAGMVHPDAVAGSTGTAKQRFWSGENIITADGGGAWNYQDAISGTAANKGYERLAFDFFPADGTGNPKLSLAPPTEYLSYLNKDLKPAQIKEVLRIANYLAAPFGTYEFTLVNYGAKDTDYTMTSNGPVLTATGNKDVVNALPNLLAETNGYTNNPGYPDITRATSEFLQTNAKYSFKPLFYAMNVTVPNDLIAASTFAPFTGSGGINYIMYDVVRGRASIADYHNAVNQWLRNGGTKLKAFYETVRAKYGDA